MDISSYEEMAKLKLSESERELISRRVDTLMDSFSEIKDSDTAEAAPLVSVLDIYNIFREDTALKYPDRDELLKNAPEENDGFFSVPKALG